MNINYCLQHNAIPVDVRFQPISSHNVMISMAYLKLCSNTLFMNIPPAGEVEEDWQKEFANDSQNITLKGLKGGLCYRVRLVALGHRDQELHHSKELLLTLPGEALPWMVASTSVWPSPASHFVTVVCRICSSLSSLHNYKESSMDFQM